MYVFAV
jgi:hypothetical protein